jgi:PEGA domain-containing protein
MPMPKTLPTGDSPASPHILVSTKAPEVETNRHALEANAGPDAAKLMVRSLPSQAQVWINGKPVGMTPMLLIVPPGKYKIELRGTRQETAQQEVALLPKETRELNVKLELRYPTRVVSH